VHDVGLSEFPFRLAKDFNHQDISLDSFVTYAIPNFPGLKRRAGTKQAETLRAMKPKAEVIVPAYKQTVEI